MPQLHAASTNCYRDLKKKKKKQTKSSFHLSLLKLSNIWIIPYLGHASSEEWLHQISNIFTLFCVCD